MGESPARAVPTENLEMGGAERRSNKRCRVGMAAHQRAREIHKMSNKFLWKLQVYSFSSCREMPVVWIHGKYGVFWGVWGLFLGKGDKGKSLQDSDNCEG